MNPEQTQALTEIIGQKSADRYAIEIAQAQTHYQTMRDLWQRKLPNANILLIDNSPRSAEAVKEWHEHIPAPLLEALAATECTTPDNASTGQRMAAMFGYQLSDPQLVRWHAPFETPTTSLDDISAIILTGSSAMVTDAPATPWMQRVIAVLQEARQKQLPIFGMCFGHQIMAEAFGGKVDWMIDSHGHRIQEMGPAFLRYTSEGQQDPVFKGLHATHNNTEGFWVQSVHSQHITMQPPNTTVLATNEISPIQALRYNNEPMWSIQNHPEYTAVLFDILSHGSTQQAEERFAVLPPETRDMLGYHTFEELLQKNLEIDTWQARTVLFANFLEFVAQ